MEVVPATRVDRCPCLIRMIDFTKNFKWKFNTGISNLNGYFGFLSTVKQKFFCHSGRVVGSAHAFILMIFLGRYDNVLTYYAEVILT